MGPSSPEAMGEDPGGVIIGIKAEDQRENLSPSRGRPWRRKHKGENLSSSLWWHRNAIGRGIITAVIVFISITIIITILIFLRGLHSRTPLQYLLEHGALCHIL